MSWEKLVPDTWPEVVLWTIVLLLLLGVVDAFTPDVDLYASVWRWVHSAADELATLFVAAKDLF